MYFDSFSAFLQMGKYGFYVWTSYGISAVLIGLNVWLALRAQRQAREQVKRQIRRESSIARGNE